MFKKAFPFSAKLHYFLIVNQNQYCPRGLFTLQPLELSLAALVTIPAKESSTGEEVILMASPITAPAQPAMFWASLQP